SAQVLAQVDLVGVLAQGDDAGLELHVLERAFVEALDVHLGRRGGKGEDQRGHQSHGVLLFDSLYWPSAARRGNLYSGTRSRGHTESVTRVRPLIVLNI